MARAKRGVRGKVTKSIGRALGGIVGWVVDFVSDIVHADGGVKVFFGIWFGLVICALVFVFFLGAWKVDDMQAIAKNALHSNYAVAIKALDFRFFEDQRYEFLVADNTRRTLDDVVVHNGVVASIHPLTDEEMAVEAVKYPELGPIIKSLKGQ